MKECFGGLGFRDHGQAIVPVKYYNKISIYHIFYLLKGGYS